MTWQVDCDVQVGDLPMAMVRMDRETDKDTAERQVHASVFAVFNLAFPNHPVVVEVIAVRKV